MNRRFAKVADDGFEFPNSRRSYDATRHAVRFWGYDSAMEASFYVSQDALKRVQPDMPLDEAGLLGALDSNRERIYEAAVKVYARGHAVRTISKRQISERSWPLGGFSQNNVVKLKIPRKIKNRISAVIPSA